MQFIKVSIFLFCAFNPIETNKIRNADNNFSLDIEAGNNINNLSVQPNGTNVQLYSTYNETSNQKFFVYKRKRL